MTGKKQTVNSCQQQTAKEKLLLAFHSLLLPSPKILTFTAIASFK